MSKIVKISEFEVKYVPGKELFVADTLSRAYITENNDNKSFCDINLDYAVNSIVRNISISEKKRDEFICATDSDSVLVLVKSMCEKG